MKWLRRVSVLALALLLPLGVSCTSEGTLTEAPLAPIEQPSQLSRVDLGGELRIFGLLTCESQRYVVAQKTIGPQGGSLTIGRHKLEIPRGALASKVTITGEQVSDTITSVRLSPEGLRFAKPARLVLSYRDCGSVGLPKRVAYTDELLRILELPQSQDYPKYEYVTGWIDHFSRYAVAY
jgi:hypothetical protein